MVNGHFGDPTGYISDVGPRYGGHRQLILNQLSGNLLTGDLTFMQRKKCELRDLEMDFPGTVKSFVEQVGCFVFFTLSDV